MRMVKLLKLQFMITLSVNVRWTYATQLTSIHQCWKAQAPNFLSHRALSHPTFLPDLLRQLTKVGRGDDFFPRNGGWNFNNKEIETFLAGSTFLPKISNEIAESTRNSTYKERFASLQNLVLVMLLLSLSMDKIVCLWNLSNKTCLNIFSHSDYGFKPITKSTRG